MSPDKDSAPTPSVKYVPSVANEFGPTQKPLSALAPSVTDLLGPILASIRSADPEATKLTGSTAEPTPAPIQEPIPSATALPISANLLASTSEYFQGDNKIVIRVIYW